MWELEAFITPTIVGGGLAGTRVTRGGTAAIHGMATAGIPITVIQVTTHIADTTATGTTGTMGTMGTMGIVGMTDILGGM